MERERSALRGSEVQGVFMKISEIMEIADLKALNKVNEEVEIKDAYVSDMLSDVMGNSKPDSLLITMLAHENTIAVASLKEIFLVILVNDRKPDEKTLNKASDEEITIVTTPKTTYETAGILYNAGLGRK